MAPCGLIAGKERGNQGKAKTEIRHIFMTFSKKQIRHLIKNGGCTPSIPFYQACKRFFFLAKIAGADESIERTVITLPTTQNTEHQHACSFCLILRETGGSMLHVTNRKAARVLMIVNTTSRQTSCIPGFQLPSIPVLKPRARNRD